MRKYILLYIFLCACLTVCLAQQTSSTIFIVKFSDKNNTPYTVGAPLQYLSQKAIDRRNNQAITISQQDFPVNNNYISQIENTGAQVLNRSKWLNAVSIYCNDSTILTQIQNLPFVVNINAVQRKAITPKESKFENDFKPLNNNLKIQQSSSTSLLDYGPAYTQIHMLNGDMLHNAGYLGNNKTIAVIDAGFLITNQCETFDSLFINNQIKGTWDFVSRHSNVYDDHYHGTYVLSIMGGNSPGSLIGTAPKADYWLLRSEDAANEYLIEEFNWVCAAEFADSVGADIINSSLGYTTFDNPAQNHTYADLDGQTAMASIGAEIAASKGMVVCNSAGNSGNNPWLRISVPADANNILTVGAVDSNENVADFSSRGNSADGRIKPDLAAQGVATVGQYQPLQFITGNGTSLSSPLIAGLCASLWEAAPTLKASELIQKILQSCDQFNSPDSLKGYGIPDFAQAYYIITGQKLEHINISRVELIAPNPFNDMIRIKYYSGDTQEIEIKMFDIMGREVLRDKLWCEGRSINDFNLPMANSMGKGLYILEIVGKKDRIIAKLIKQ
ncbi:MAG: S8 family serine peptidase [Bacteroidia bacterium]|nr:S8 family serine peptidase [Bacteroidia bacterium]MCZ2248648.1 S8 family serine peptidase [Bacteroidia bacterium]